MTWKGKKGKSKLIQELVAKGFSYRQAGKAVNAVFGQMARAVRRGERTEIPGGTIQVMQNNRKRPELKKYRNIATGRISYKVVVYGRAQRRIKFLPDQQLNVELIPKPPGPPTPEELEIRELVLLFTGRPPTAQDIAVLQRAIEWRPHKSGALLRRLRQYEERGGKRISISYLAQYMEFFYWL